MEAQQGIYLDGDASDRIEERVLDMTFQEYPKMLYKGDDQCIVHDAEEESQCCKDGWGNGGEAPTEEKPKKAKK